jgi:thiol-disulfide isomerase/thioredoxin
VKLLAILQTDCPTCRLIAPYLNSLSDSADVRGVSQDNRDATREFVRQMDVRFPVDLDPGYLISKRLSVVTVPTLYVFDEQDRVVRTEPGFDKGVLNEVAAMLGHAPVATPYDGAPASKPGCTSRHLEVQTEDAGAVPLDLHSTRGAAA